MVPVLTSGSIHPFSHLLPDGLDLRGTKDAGDRDFGRLSGERRRADAQAAVRW